MTHLPLMHCKGSSSFEILIVTPALQARSDF